MTTVLYRGGRVHAPDPDATALLVRDGRIAWVGADADAPSSAGVEIVDLDGAWVAPAFVDAHVHATTTGLALTGLDLTDAPSLAVALDRVRKAAESARGGAILGTGWDDTRWPERRPPTAVELDRASYGGVVYLARTDVHSAVASSALLAVAPEARSAPGWVGEGLVRQSAHHIVRKAALSSLSRTQRRDAQRATLDRAAGLGIACVHECGGPDIGGEQDFTDLLALAGEGGVPRVVGYWGELGGIERARDLGAAGAAGDLFVDGSLGSHTAWLREPYADATDCGQAYLDADEIARHVIACTRADMQAGFHAIGDAAVAAVIAGVQLAAEDVGRDRVRARRHRIEHAEMADSPAMAAMGDLGMVASMQPVFDARWGGEADMYVERVGPDRARGMNNLAGLAEAGATLAFGSDSPVTPIDPWGTLRAAVAHQSPGSAVSAPTAFAAHTVGGWRAARDDESGVLVPGAPATFAIWAVAGELRDGLPALDEDDPMCLRTVLAGSTLFAR